ncbi:MAG: DUF3533 domain-containing protein [Actinobacteria bacterium]|nr:DUF3533 domain-containing protein [Actinomycetota bacterium]
MSPRRRVAAFGLGALVIGLGFIFSYVAAFHDPKPHSVKLAVVAPGAAATEVVERLNALPGTPLEASVATGEAAARRQVRDDKVSGALVVDPSGTTDRLVLAGAAGGALSSALEEVVELVEAGEERSVKVVDVVPLQGGDYRGLTSFYVVVGWLVCGYLLAALLGILSGSRPASVRAVGERLALLLAYSAAAGIGGALIIGPLLGALSGDFVAIAALGALLTFAAGAVTLALEELLGIAGIGVAILLFVVLGNPSAGGAYQAELLPGFWRAIGDLIPNGAGVEAARRIVYFDGDGALGHILVIIVWILVAVLAAVATASRRQVVGRSAGVDR